MADDEGEDAGGAEGAAVDRLASVQRWVTLPLDGRSTRVGLLRLWELAEPFRKVGRLTVSKPVLTAPTASALLGAGASILGTGAVLSHSPKPYSWVRARAPAPGAVKLN